MADISIRELRNHGGEVVDRAAKGEHVTITRSGKPVAELRPLPQAPASLKAIIERRRQLLHVDPADLRRDLDQLLDPGL